MSALDLLHTNHLGVMLLYCCHVACDFLRSGVRRTSKLLSWIWYASKRLSNPTENLTQVADVTPSLFGSMEDPKLKMKAAETW